MFLIVVFYIVLETNIKWKQIMNVTEEAGKNSGRIKCHWIEKKFIQDLLSIVFCIKPSLKSTFVQSSNRQNFNE